MVLVLSAFLCLASGLLLVRMAWPRTEVLVSNLVLQLSLSVGYGLGIFSIEYFVSRVAGIAHLILIDLGVFALLLIAFSILRGRFAAHALPVFNGDPSEPAWLRRTVSAAFTIALLAALYSAIMRAVAYSDGNGWDAFAIWNLHARFLFLGGLNWRDGFTALIPWSHPDYPLLLPAAIAHFWTVLGHEDPAIPSTIGLLFTFSTVGLLVSSLSILRDRTVSMLGGITLLATPAFIEVGTAQYADVPLSFFFLATAALFCLGDSGSHKNSRGALILAGLAASFGAWTKNEGTLFLCAIVLSYLLISVRQKFRNSSAETISHLWPFLVAAVPVLLVALYFKHFVAPANDLFSDSTTTLHKLMTPARYWAVIQWFVKQFFRFGHWVVPITLLMLGYYFAASKEGRTPVTHTFDIVRLALLMTLAGYFAIYLITPYEIYWHLRFSLDRLFLQLWPSTIFLFFLWLPRGVNQPAS